jgi:uncharacterized protein YbbK (DUF523 family)
MKENAVMICPEQELTPGLPGCPRRSAIIYENLRQIVHPFARSATSAPIHGKLKFELIAKAKS